MLTFVQYYFYDGLKHVRENTFRDEENIIHFSSNYLRLSEGFTFVSTVWQSDKHKWVQTVLMLFFYADTCEKRQFAHDNSCTSYRITMLL